MARIFSLWYIFLSGFLVLSCQHAEQEINADFELNSAWEFRMAGNNQWMPASVPGDVASDLFRNHKIPVPSISHIRQIQWIDTTDWEYRTSFDIPSQILTHNSINLNFGNLNSHADIYLNDSIILKTNNMFRTWDIGCKQLLKPTGNRLRIYFHSLKKEDSGSFIRRTGFQTNLPDEWRLQNTGIGRSVRIQAWSVAKIDEVCFHQVALSSLKAVYTATISAVAANDDNVSIEILINNKVIGQIPKWILKKGTNIHSVPFSIKKPKLWYPNELGKPNLYNVSVRLKKGNNIIQETQNHLGIRTIEIVSPKNNQGPFYFKVNGTPLFIKGAEYVPGNFANLFVDEAVRKHLVETARSSHSNLIRITNEGIYEDENFYNFCDENGILLWQDFMLNEAHSLSDTLWWNNIETETTGIIKQYRNHPCLALWSGNCESLNSSANPKDNNRLFQNFLPGLVRKYSGQTVYKVSSHLKFGLSIDNPLVTPLIDDNTLASWPSLQTINHGGLPVDLKLPNTLTNNYLRKNYKSPGNIESLIYLSQLAQADVIKNTIETQRRNRPVCMGFIFRLINDYTQSLSSSTTDSKHWKPAMFSIKNAYSHILVMPVREKGNVNIYASSDALKDQDAILLTKLIDFSGNDIFVKQIPVQLKANSCRLLLTIKESDLIKNVSKSQCCLVVQLNQPNITLSQNILYFTEPGNLSLTKPQISININQSIKGYNLILRTDRLAKNVWLETTSGEALFSDNNFDLLPGKRTKIPIRYSGSKDALYKDLKIKSLANAK